MNHTTSDIAVRDTWVAHAEGRMFSRRWQLDAVQPAAERSPLVLFHDSLGCVALWRDFPERLVRATGRPVVAYDRLGFGQSDPRSGRPPLGFVAEERHRYFEPVREQLGIDRFVALGHSVGGGKAVHVARDPRCEALVTVAAQAFVEDRTVVGLRAAREAFRSPDQPERLARHHGDKAAWALDAWLGNWLDPRFAAWSLTEALPLVSCPVLAIHGDQDEYGSTRHAEAIARGVSGPARVEVLAGAGHVPHRECPERMVALVSEFLDKV